ncbi:translation initiation factor IF-3 [Borrelia anserina]|uniref:Translation initiation factor IF-3 n=2 Tax=Borrelia anserina TaxID=143 RepID=W5SSY9_BORAN|nr:translation initiation factor IF-3 [Borrelia anserina]AHH08151.1 Bacterial Protein Translation Initiation Factor 3 (IF-3) [Borrelia anserina BA2]AHH08842.1 Bacterial Protein Translation Initiation Factor 3 (IF-3) [Borrelia anserina BA2]APR64685.1 translation initiation factor IF-3 [Borrelia anserina Es]UPA06599.1 translation initiation factor IF-3 [Borrelia anserina]
MINRSFGKDKDRSKSSSKELRINNKIKAREVRVIFDDGTQSVLLIEDAIKYARDAELDLVEVSPNVLPPVCKIIDYGKYKFHQEKRQKEQRKNQKIIKLKEVRMQPKIDVHDLDFKYRNILGFLKEGNRVKVTIRFRGRELAHTHLGYGILESILEKVGDSNYVLESPAKMEGKTMFLIIAPKSKK